MLEATPMAPLTPRPLTCGLAVTGRHGRGADGPAGAVERRRHRAPGGGVADDQPDPGTESGGEGQCVHLRVAEGPGADCRVPALTWVPAPTAVVTTGELIAVATPPLTPAASPIDPRLSRANAGATVVLPSSPGRISWAYVGLIGAPAASVLTRETRETVVPLIEPPPTLKVRTVGARSALVDDEARADAKEGRTEAEGVDDRRRDRVGQEGRGPVVGGHLCLVTQVGEHGRLGGRRGRTAPPLKPRLKPTVVDLANGREM